MRHDTRQEASGNDAFIVGDLLKLFHAIDVIFSEID